MIVSFRCEVGEDDSEIIFTNNFTSKLRQLDRVLKNSIEFIFDLISGSLLCERKLSRWKKLTLFLLSVYDIRYVNSIYM